MKDLAPGVQRLFGLPPNAINVYLVDDVLIDAASRLASRRILRQIIDRPVSMVALTHVHPDHQGSSKLVCQEFGVPFWVPEGDAEKAERPDAMREEQPSNAINKLFFKAMAGPGHPVDRPLREGDEVAGFEVLETPGHSRGHISFWRESDRVLVLGDVLNSMDVFTAIPGLREPKKSFTPDPARNRASARRLGELEPSLVCFGHGAPVRDTRKFVEFCRSLPA